MNTTSTTGAMKPDIIRRVENAISDFYRHRGSMPSSIYVGHEDYVALRQHAPPHHIQAPCAAGEPYEFMGLALYVVNASHHLGVGV